MAIGVTWAGTKTKEEGQFVLMFVFKARKSHDAWRWRLADIPLLLYCVTGAHTAPV